MRHEVMDVQVSLPLPFLVLDVGSRRVQSDQPTYRSLFEMGAKYIGCDVEPGENVDVVQSHPYLLPFEDAAFDLVISGQVLEHVQEPWYLVREMARVLKPRGRMILTAPWMWEIHSYPEDYWRILPHAMDWLLRQAGLCADRVFTHERDCWGVATKEAKIDAKPTILCVCTGGQCRSVMVAAWLRSMGREAWAAGVAPGSNVFPEVQDALRRNRCPNNAPPDFPGLTLPPQSASSALAMLADRGVPVQIAALSDTALANLPQAGATPFTHLMLDPTEINAMWGKTRFDMDGFLATSLIAREVAQQIVAQ
jgi:SAM-dependent methyltransferase